MFWPRTGPKRTENVMSWEDCSSRCRERPECKYWTWFDQNNRIPRNRNVCVTVTNAGNVRNKINAWSGTRECGGEIFILSTNYWPLLMSLSPLNHGRSA